MKINKLLIVGLHGYIDKEIDFNQDLTLLVGINGSGKTSILNIIKWLLDPSIPYLCVTEFVSVKLYFELKGVEHRIECKHNKVNFTYRIYSGNKAFSPLIVKIQTHPKDIKNDDSLKINLIQHYTSLSPDQKEKQTWDLIASLPNPTVIGLDRNIFTEESHRLYIEESIRGKIAKKNHLSNSSPLERVKEIVNREYRKKKNSILNLTSGLKNHLMLSTFDGSITFQSMTSGIRHNLKISEIDGVELRVNDYFRNFEKGILSDVERNTIKRYFHQLKEITQQYQDKPDDSNVRFLYGLNANQFVKVNKLLKEFEKFEKASNSALEQINTYIDTLNFFFRDSAKKILFKEDTSELAFHTVNRDGKVSGEYKDIKFLSSGEQQLLILFSYIAFNGGEGRLFIIDEPELSLHIKWQEDFLGQLERITPKMTQLILATHSPILANKKRDKAKVLLPFNS